MFGWGRDAASRPVPRAFWSNPSEPLGDGPVPQPAAYAVRGRAILVPRARRIYYPGVPVEAPKCPNCGAPLKLDARLACEFCHTPIKVTTPAGRTDREAIIKAIDPSGPFAMQIDDVFVIRGRGTVVTGTIVSGTVRVGDRLEVDGPKGAVATKCQGVEMFRKSLTVGIAGNNVGLMLERVRRDDVAQGGWVRAAG